MWTCVAVALETRGGHRISGHGIKENCESLCEGWEVDLGSLEEQPVLLITVSSLHP